MAVATISGIRGVLNRDLLPSEIIGYVRGFSSIAVSQEVLLGRDTRTTGEVFGRLVKSALLEAGKGVVDYGVITTPALFRESRIRERAAVMVTASHNEPEWNGLKFVVNGRGVVQAELDRILKPGREVPGSGVGVVRAGRRPSYGGELVAIAGEGSCEGLRVAADLNGGAAIVCAPDIFRALGCELTVLGGSAGVFSRTIDPTNDELELLARTVKEKACDVGFAFDCDGDRLVMVDSEGRKRTGDYMLTLAIAEILPTMQDRSVVVSADTTQAVDEIVSGLGGKTYRSKVGEANVISKMLEQSARVGGEGSSGGLIDGSFNLCRDSMLAAITIAKAIKRKGKRVLDQVPSYNLERMKFPLERKKAAVAIKRLQKENPEADTMDGVKIWTSRRSWVLIRQSGTEDIVRISSESASAKEARDLAELYSEKLKRLSER